MSYTDVIKTIQHSKLLLHVESFDKEFLDRTRYSVSTKIADSLSSTVPLFAYGPSELASIEHLIDKKCAFVCDDIIKLESLLYDALFDDEKRQAIKQNQKAVADKYHNVTINSLTIKETLLKTISSVN